MVKMLFFAWIKSAFTGLQIFGTKIILICLKTRPSITEQKNYNKFTFRIKEKKLQNFSLRNFTERYMRLFHAISKTHSKNHGMKRIHYIILYE